MSILTANDPDSNVLLSVVEHVFMPPKLPQEDPGDAIEQKMNVALCDHLIGASQVFLQDALQDVSPSQRSLWENMIKMIKLARRAADIPFEEAELQGVFSNMAIEGMSIQLPPCSTFNLTFLNQTFSLCIFARRMLVSLCAGFLPTSFSSRRSRSRHRILR
jgi:hypothetical protein